MGKLASRAAGVPSDEHEAGQFLFVEEYTSLPLLDAFCDFLIAGDPEFEYGWPLEDRMRFMDLGARLQELTEEAAERHVLAASPDYDERTEDTLSAS